MFPSPEYIQECIEHQKELREEWEKRGPKYLDMMAVLDSGVLEKVAPLFIPKIIDTWDVVWLPRLDQLIEMLEERGYDWGVELHSLRDEDKRCQARALGLCSKPNTVAEIKALGPDPATALLRAWLSLDPVGEVVKEE